MTTKKQAQFENPYLGYTETGLTTAREIWGWQVKMTQSLFDQSVKTVQTWSDFVQTQAQEAAKISQDMFKTGLQNTEEVKKSFSHFNEKITANYK
jgi:hypothetical protein